jgi:hypothetical protein
VGFQCSVQGFARSVFGIEDVYHKALGAPDSYDVTGKSYWATSGVCQETENRPFMPAAVAAATGCRNGISTGREILGASYSGHSLEMLPPVPSPERQEMTPWVEPATTGMIEILSRGRKGTLDWETERVSPRPLRSQSKLYQPVENSVNANRTTFIRISKKNCATNARFASQTRRKRVIHHVTSGCDSQIIPG